MNAAKLYRKRFIPNETILLKDDCIVYRDEELMVTKWDVLKPRKDFQKGISCYFLKKGFKVSKFLNKNDQLVYYYCDIIETQHDVEKDEYVFIDLLVDVIIERDGQIRLLDLGELADALEEKLITPAMMQKALWQLDSLLTILYQQDCGTFLDRHLKKAGALA